VDQISRKYLVDPVRVTVGEISRAAPKIDQSIIETTQGGKNEALLDELNRRPGSVLVFARTKSRTDRVAKYLASYGVAVNRLHGGRSQGQRNLALNSFRNGQTRVLVATDIAARGIDVTGVAHVINYDLSHLTESYVHRIGRTARAGAAGKALTLCTSEEKSFLFAIEKETRAKIHLWPDNPFHSVAAETAPVIGVGKAKAALEAKRIANKQANRKGGSGRRHGGGGGGGSSARASSSNEGRKSGGTSSAGGRSGGGHSSGGGKSKASYAAKKSFRGKSNSRRG
jgi:ATP-dependent RNA helicase RhlE